MSCLLLGNAEKAVRFKENLKICKVVSLIKQKNIQIAACQGRGLKEVVNKFA